MNATCYARMSSHIVGATMISTSYHVVIADDEPGVRGLLARVVARTFAAVVISAVTDGQEALNIVMQQHVDLLITNNQMPGLTGLELIRAARANGYTGPIVMVSGDKQLGGEALTAGATAFVEKPFTVTGFAAILRRLLP
jgi:CheY-like chemotaxis protein